MLALNEQEVREAVNELKRLEVESIAVCLLFSFKNNEHEFRIREIIGEEYPEAYVSLSCEVLPQVREFDRFSTTILNAYLSPKLNNYLRQLEISLNEAGFGGSLFIKLSNGGVMDIDYCCKRGWNLSSQGRPAA